MMTVGSTNYIVCEYYSVAYLYLMIVVFLQVESNVVMFSPDKIEILMTILNARQTSLGIITKQVFPQLLQQLMSFFFN